MSLTDRADTFSDCIKAMEELLEKRDECRKRKTVCVCVFGRDCEIITVEDTGPRERQV